MVHDAQVIRRQIDHAQDVWPVFDRYGLGVAFKDPGASPAVISDESVSPVSADRKVR